MIQYPRVRPILKIMVRPCKCMIGSTAMRIRVQFTTLVGILLIGLSTLAAAQTRTPIDVSTLGPQVGDRVPEFSLPDQAGQIQTLESIRGPNGTLLLFYRSADW